MLAGYDAKGICNHILSEWDAKLHRITNKKINKLLFFAHGFHLIRTGQPLVRNNFEAWEHGPVVKVIYHEFKEFGYSPIEKLAYSFDYNEGIDKPFFCNIMSDPDYDRIMSVIQHYMAFSADELEAMSHEKDGPWDWVRNRNEGGLGGRIPNELIKSHFQTRFGAALN